MAGFTRALGGGVVAIDGKSLRAAFERGRRSTPLHLVNVWAAEQCLAPKNQTGGPVLVLAPRPYAIALPGGPSIPAHGVAVGGYQQDAYGL